MLKIASILLLALTSGVVFAEDVEHTKEPMTDVKKAIESGKAVLIDVREKPEWDAGHLKSASLVPLRALKSANLAPADLPKDKPVYVHCRAGARALTATEILRKLGYDARAIKEGYDDLVKAGFEKVDKK